MTWVFYGHYENQFVVAQNKLALASNALSSLRTALKIVIITSMLWMGKQFCQLSH